ncbi:exosortase F system-associated protein [uncultured Lutibacter sp.]|uniref:exosortase F system-associated membrane protein n=1 Tax=uncultured Lutibacter sp. TaxID=437739 RepID=UPI0034378D17
MKKQVRIILILILVSLLIGVRAFLEPLFYDPLIEYFKSSVASNQIPELDFSIYFFNIFLRYFINTVISIAIIYLVFKKLNTLIFVLKFYVGSFFVLSILLFCLLYFKSLHNDLFIFYVRRFLIQPLFLFVLLPALYYQKLKIKK